MKIYTASKPIHAKIWRDWRDIDGIPVSSTWIDEAGEGETLSYEDLWRRCVEEASACDILVVYRAQANETLKGALVEAGCALSKGREVFYAGPVDGYSFLNHKNVKRFSSLDEVRLFILGMQYKGIGNV